MRRRQAVVGVFPGRGQVAGDKEALALVAEVLELLQSVIDRAPLRARSPDRYQRQQTHAARSFERGIHPVGHHPVQTGGPMHGVSEQVSIGGRHAGEGVWRRPRAHRGRGIGETVSPGVGEDGVEQFVAIEKEQVPAGQPRHQGRVIGGRQAGEQSRTGRRQASGSGGPADIWNADDNQVTDAGRLETGHLRGHRIRRGQHGRVGDLGRAAAAYPRRLDKDVVRPTQERVECFCIDGSAGQKIADLGAHRRDERPQKREVVETAGLQIDACTTYRKIVAAGDRGESRRCPGLPGGIGGADRLAVTGAEVLAPDGAGVGGETGVRPDQRLVGTRIGQTVAEDSDVRIIAGLYDGNHAKQQGRQDGSAFRGQARLPMHFTLLAKFCILAGRRSPTAPGAPIRRVSSGISRVSCRWNGCAASARRAAKSPTAAG
jgi:hypothetical protein